MPALFDRGSSSLFEHNNDGTITQYNSTRCAHCHHVLVQEPGTNMVMVFDEAGKKTLVERSFCGKCGIKQVCGPCAAIGWRTGECVAYERALDKAERLGKFYSEHYPKLDRDQAILINTR